MDSEVPPGAPVFWPGASQTRNARVYAKWDHLFSGARFSPLDYYAAVEEAATRRQIPELKMSRVTWKEGGLLSARREYLRLERRQYVFDLCAAPFGTNFFFSSWVVVKPRRLTGCHFAGMAASICGLVLLLTLGLERLPWLCVVVAGVFIGLARAKKLDFSFVERVNVEDFILGMTFIGAILDVLFRPFTYFEEDTAAMFEKTVHGAMMEVIDGLTKEQGIPLLSAEERKPVMRDFFKK